MKAFTFVSITILFFGAQALRAQGVLFVQQETTNGKSATNQIQMDKTHIRSESHTSGESVAILFDAPSQTVRMLNLDKKTYMELNKAQMEQMKQQMGGASAQMTAAQKEMEERMKNM